MIDGRRAERRPAVGRQDLRRGRRGSAARCRGPGRRGSSRSGPSRALGLRPISTAGMPGMVPPITGRLGEVDPRQHPDRRRAQREMRVGREKRAARRGPRRRGGEGVRRAGRPDRGDRVERVARGRLPGGGRRRPGRAPPNSGRPIDGAFGASGRMSRTRSSGSSSDEPARAASRREPCRSAAAPSASAMRGCRPASRARSRA